MRRNPWQMGAMLLAFILATTTIFAQTISERQKISNSYNQTKLTQLSRNFKAEAESKRSQALQMAAQNGWEVNRRNIDGSFDELIAVSLDGQPIYYTIYNVNAARSTRANHLNIGGSLGLSLDGQNMTAHVWDGGPTRLTHQEFDGAGGNNRVSINDGVTGLNGNSFHAQHVTGTIVASGFQAAAKGMAPRANALTHDWNNDLAEATTEAANGMLLSNHSYGYRADLVPDWYFGAYLDESRDWDNLMYNSPYYLMVVAGGNDGNDNSSNGSPLNGNSSYDKLTGHSTSKNNMVVANGQDANIAANGTLNSVSINTGSSEGPTDDLRIKPDITGNGTSVYSTYDNSDNAYNSISGTSMASPNVTGTLLLLQQHYNNVNSNYMRSATLKGLALHTADDAGTSGPDVIFGWGLLNAKRAAEAISDDGNGAIINELTLSPGQTYTLNVDADGVNPLMASISWTDPAGTANTGTTNLTTPVLVNDLDIRVSNGTTYSPYRLTSITSNNKGDNNVDPFERVDINGAAGSYTITVTHKGSLSGGSQDFSLVVTGVTGTPPVCNATTPTGVNASGVGSSTATIGWNAVANATYDVRYRATGTSTWTTNAVSGTSTGLSGLAATTQYEAQVRSKCSGGSNSAYSSSTTFTTTEVQLNYCASNGNSVADEYISRVQVGTINNATGASSSGYADYTSISTSANKGASVSITVTPTWTGTTYSEGYSAWIDYNQDGDFADAGEQVWTQAATQNTSVSGSFTIPASAAEGNTRMRVSMKYNAIPTSCESFQYGEVEDYTITIGGGDTQAPTAPTSLAASSVTQTTLTLNWSASNDNVGVTGYDVYQGASNIGTVTATSANITGLTAGTAYTFSVRAKDAAGNVSAASNVVNVTTQSAGMSCSSIATLPYSEGFESGFGAWTNLTGDDLNWTRRSGSTPSSSTGPSSASAGSFYMYVESSSPNFPSKVTRIESPCYDLSGESSATFSFKYHMYGSTMGTLALQASTNGTTWTSVWSQSGNKGNSWLTANVNMDAYAGETVKLRFVGTTGSSYTGDMAVDAISFTAGGGSGTTNVALTLTFDNYPEETSWQILDGSTVVANGGTYASQADGSTLVVNVALSTGCYDFVINDTYGDGICCSYGNGSYSLADGGSTLASGGSFGSSETTAFCVGGATSSMGYSITSSIGQPTRVEMYPNPAVRTLNLASSREESTFTITNMMGQVVSSGRVVNGKVNLDKIESGMYMIQLLDKGGKSLTKKFVKQ